jgi:hypothetical protein
MAFIMLWHLLPWHLLHAILAGPAVRAAVPVVRVWNEANARREREWHSHAAFCFLLGDKASLTLSPKIKQKYIDGTIHRKLKVPTSEREGELSNPRARAARPARAPCMEKIHEKFTEIRARAPRGRHASILPRPKIQGVY